MKRFLLPKGGGGSATENDKEALYYSNILTSIDFYCNQFKAYNKDILNEYL